MEQRTVHIQQSLLAAIRKHGAESYPHECCGVLLGKDTENFREIVDIIPLENRKQEQRERRYLIEPEDILQAEKMARERKLDVLGFYHSHPDHPAEPSEFDRNHAWPWYSYIIVAVKNGQPEALRSWQLRDDRAQFDEEVLIHSTTFL